MNWTKCSLPISLTPRLILICTHGHPLQVTAEFELLVHVANLTCTWATFINQHVTDQDQVPGSSHHQTRSTQQERENMTSLYHPRARVRVAAVPRSVPCCTNRILVSKTTQRPQKTIHQVGECFFFMLAYCTCVYAPCCEVMQFQ